MIDLPIETLTSIFYFIDEPEQYKHVNLTCSLFNDINREFYAEKQYNMTNQLTTLLTRFPTENWDWSYVSKNKCVSMDFIISHPELPWDYMDVFSNPNFTIDLWDIIGELYSENDNAPLYTHWVFKSYIEGHPTLDIDFVLENHTDCNFEADIWNMASTHIDTKYIDIFPDFPWKYAFVSENRTLTQEFIENHSNEDWDMDDLSSNPAVCMGFIRKHPQMNWNWRSISLNINLTFEFVLDNLDKELNWSAISALDDLPLEFVIEHSDYNWQWQWISSHKDLSVQVLRDFPDLQWDWMSVSMNANISIQTITKNIDLPWIWYMVVQRGDFDPTCIDIRSDCLGGRHRKCRTECLTILYDGFDPTTIKDHEVEIQTWKFMSACPNLTLEFILDTGDIDPDSWNWAWATRSLFRSDNCKRRQIQSFGSLNDNPDLPWDWEFLSLSTFGK